MHVNGQEQGSQTFYGKGQIANISDFVGYTASVLTAGRDD